MQNSIRTAFAIVTLVMSTAAFSQDKSTAANSPHGSGHAVQGQMGHGAMQDSPAAAKADFDQQFLDTMAVHHQGAIDMARLVEKRSAHDELKQMARKTIDDQQSEIKQMKDWKQQWYADKGDAVNMKMLGMMDSMKGMDTSMEKLQASSGDAFDAMFLSMMSKHHQGAVKMAQDALGKAKHPEVKEMAKKIVDAQKGEIAQMAKWKKEWKLAGK